MTRDKAKEIISYHKNLVDMDTSGLLDKQLEYQAIDMAIKALEQESKTGHWMKSNIGGAKVCSVCNAHMGLSSFKFCPNCGAEMKGEVEE